MASKTYRGSCHCGAVTIEADIDLAKGTSKCNCTFCWKTRKWGIGIKPDALRVLSGSADLTDYSRSEQVHNVFCKHCGVRPYSYGDIPEVGGAFVSINLSCLDDLPAAELAALPVQYMDGRHDNWWNVPAETQHL